MHAGHSRRLAAAFFLFGMGKTYTSTASLWVDTAAPVPSSIGADTGSALSEPPAATAQAILSELLTTRPSLPRSQTLVAWQIRRAARTRPKGMPSRCRGMGRSRRQSRAGRCCRSAIRLRRQPWLRASFARVVTQLRDYTNRLTARHDQATVAYERQQAKAAETALAAARSNVTAYQERHLGATQADPNYASLVAAENNATTQLAQANTALSQARQRSRLVDAGDSIRLARRARRRCANRRWSR